QPLVGTWQTTPVFHRQLRDGDAAAGAVRQGQLLVIDEEIGRESARRLKERVGDVVGVDLVAGQEQRRRTIASGCRADLTCDPLVEPDQGVGSVTAGAPARPVYDPGPAARA